MNIIVAHHLRAVSSRALSAAVQASRSPALICLRSSRMLAIPWRTPAVRNLVNKTPIDGSKDQNSTSFLASHDSSGLPNDYTATIHALRATQEARNDLQQAEERARQAKHEAQTAFEGLKAAEEGALSKLKQATRLVQDSLASKHVTTDTSAGMIPGSDELKADMAGQVSSLLSDSDIKSDQLSNGDRSVAQRVSSIQRGPGQICGQPGTTVVRQSQVAAAESGNHFIY